MESIVYDGSPDARAKLAGWLDEGAILLCPKCKARLIIALDAESAAAHRVHPGIYCSSDPKHFFELHELISQEIRDMRAKWKTWAERKV